LHRPPQSYLGPRFSDKETLEERYTSQWSARPPLARPLAEEALDARRSTDAPTPGYDARTPRFVDQRPVDSAVEPSHQPPRPPQSLAERSARSEYFEQRYSSRERIVADELAAAPQASVQRVEMRYTAHAPTTAAPPRADDVAVAETRHSMHTPPLIARWQARWQGSALRQQIDAIVSQGRSGQKQSAVPKLPSFNLDTLPFGRINLQQLAQDLAAGRFEQVATQISWPGTVRVGLLSVIVFLLWWTWPTAPVLPANSGSLASAALAPAIQSRIGDAGNLDAAARTILVPTAAPVAMAAEVIVPQATVAADPAVVTMQVNGDAIPASGLSALAGILVATTTPARVDAAVVTVSVPQIQLIPGVGINLPFGGPTPTATPTPTPTPSPVPVNLAPGRLWSTFAPGPESDHFWVGRAFGPNATQLASPSYQFGSTAGERYRTHHGVDVSNPQGTPVLAATDGEVVHAGPDDTVLLGPYNNFYGNVVVIRLDRKLSVAGGELDVFLLYGHLSQVTVSVGQRVRPEEVVGMVGMTGIAIGPHLHIEIRLGANTYFNNVNPYLWMAPLEGQGAVAVRVLTVDGRTWPAARISLVRYAGGSAVWARQIETYMDVENIGPDPAWGENGAMDGGPAGSYYVIGVINGERVNAEIEVNAGRTTFVELRTQQ